MITFKIPRQIQVGGHKYQIMLSPDLKDSNTNAAVNHRLQVVVINSERPESQKIEGLVHELVHIINSIYGCGLEEPQVNRIGQGLFQVFSQLGIKLDWSEIPVKNMLIDF